MKDSGTTEWVLRRDREYNIIHSADYPEETHCPSTAYTFAHCRPKPHKEKRPKKVNEELVSEDKKNQINTAQAQRAKKCKRRWLITVIRPAE